MNPGIVKMIVRSARREHHAYIRLRKRRNAVPHTPEYWLLDEFAWHCKMAAFEHMCNAWMVSGRRPARDRVRIAARAAKAEMMMREAA